MAEDTGHFKWQPLVKQDAELIHSKRLKNCQDVKPRFPCYPYVENSVSNSLLWLYFCGQTLHQDDSACSRGRKGKYLKKLIY